MSCPSGKRCFSTKRYAKEALKKGRRVGRRDGYPPPKQFYLCACGQYHLTSQPKLKDIITSQIARQVI